MHRIMIRLLVALLTFAIGFASTVLLNGFSALFTKKAERPTVSLSIETPTAPPESDNRTTSITCGCHGDSTKVNSFSGVSDNQIPIISGGVLNWRAISLPQPPLPPVAKAARVSGTVTVQILVNERGCVISAYAVSGHPLLQAAAAQAARQACFTPTRLRGESVRVSGILIYDFMLP